MGDNVMAKQDVMAKQAAGPALDIKINQVAMLNRECIIDAMRIMSMLVNDKVLEEEKCKEFSSKLPMQTAGEALGYIEQQSAQLHGMLWEIIDLIGKHIGQFKLE